MTSFFANISDLRDLSGRHRAWHLGMLSTFITGVIGCAPTARLPDVVVAETVTSPEEPRDLPADETVLRHDFGVIYPGAVVTHVFRVQNNTDSRWNISTIRRACNCTAASVSGNAIEARDAIDVTVEYRAPNTAADESRSLVVHFHEPTTLPVRLNVTSCVRPAVHISPGSVNFQDITGARAVYRTVQVLNYGDVAWEGVKVLSHPEWLVITSEKVRRDIIADASRRPAIEEWLLTVKTNSNVPPPGIHRTNLVVTPTNANLGLSGTLPVSLTTVTALEAMPKQASLGTLRAGQAAEREFVLVLSEETAQLPVELIQLKADIAGCETKHSWITTEGRYRRIRLSFTPLVDAGDFKGVVRIVASGFDSKPCTIAVAGNIAEAEGKSD